MTEITIKKAAISDLSAVTALAQKLFSLSDVLEVEMELLLSDEGAAIFIAYVENVPAGFAQVQLRRDYVEGTATSPVGYLEGVYTETAFRKQGIAKRLVEICEAWAKEKGCLEFASDCELANSDSILFHKAIGFLEANRIVCFVKGLL
ncbi:MAG: GNAT family N-acetyltransferase [Clostridiales bacterium]|nr:GNAT family N-acetyltransferase [Clostridiales bacterium]